MAEYLDGELKLEFNDKTQVFPIRNGVDYLGFHTYLTENGKVIRKVRQQTKKRYKRRMKQMQKAYGCGEMTYEEIRQVMNSYYAHLSYGNTYGLRKKVLEEYGVFRVDI